MLLENLNQNIKKVKKFPTGKNIRVKIEGLAVCQFDDSDDTTSPTQSICHFLQGITEHKLKFSIVRVNPDGTKTIIQDVTDITEDIGSITIGGNHLKRPANYIYEPQLSGEHELERLLNLSKIHKEQFIVANSAETTKMTLKNCSFYTFQKTSKSFKVTLKGIGKKFANLCEVIGGYIECQSRTIDIDIPGIYTDRLAISENGNSYKYEIAFTNHCHGTTAQCFGTTLGADVKFLYRILTPPKGDADKIVLEQLRLNEFGKRAFSADVAACLPGSTEPCDTCS
ncbi:MAG TPA: hypothetical protein VGC97_25640 [Pyrinomonadaceae bacterium]|jgi:hypothetical protein